MVFPGIEKRLSLRAIPESPAHAGLRHRDCLRLYRLRHHH
jgi:hypothetical protein